jgi:phosphoserine phosphatase
MLNINNIKLYLFIIILLFSAISLASPENDPLPSWNNGPVKQSIISFVQDVTNKSSKDYVSPENRIATIDNDGTLWVEQPLYTQFLFVIDRIKKLSVKHPEWQYQEPFKSVLENNYKNLSEHDLMQLIALSSSGMSVQSYNNLVQQWLDTTINPHFKHHYIELVYKPMLEVINYLQRNNFNVYICTGGGQDFVRAFAQNIYHVAPENIIGSAAQTEYTYQNGAPILIKEPKILFINDKEGKPEDINLFIGKKPIIAFGNSDGDQQMLEWTGSSPGKKLMLLVHHDDPVREYAYDTQSHIGTFSTSLFNEAEKNHWLIISMKNDWKVIFPYEK